MQTPDIVAAHDGIQILDNLFNLGFFWTKNYVNHQPQRSVVPGEVLDYRWPSRDRIVLFRKGQQWPSEPNIERGNGKGGLQPRIELHNVRLSGYDHIAFGDITPTGSPNVVTAIKGRYTLIPGQTQNYALTTAQSNTDAFSRAVADTLEASAKQRLGGSASLVGGELNELVRHALTDTTTKTQLESVSFNSGGQYKNEFDHPIIVETNGDRHEGEAYSDIEALAVLEYEIRFYPLERNEGYYSWASKEQFASSMRGEEPADVGAYSLGGRESISEIAQRMPNPGFHFDITPYQIKERVKFNRAISEEFTTQIVG